MAQLTIGLPVYNGAELLPRSLDHLLAQTYKDFVLIVNDNASTDATAEISKEYARRDSRVQYFRNDENVCWNENFRIVLGRATTPYFMWATHDDIWLPRFAEANIALLEANPSASLSTSKIIYFTNEGQRVLAGDTGPLRGTPADRINKLFLLLDRCGRLYGVYRTEILKKSFPVDLHIPAADWLVVALTLLYGDHVEVDEVLLEREDQPRGHYLRAHGRIDRFAPTWIDWLVPLHRFNRELQRQLPREVWSGVRKSLSYLNLRVCAGMLEEAVPALKFIWIPARNLAAGLFHRRWRVSQAR